MQKLILLSLVAVAGLVYAETDMGRLSSAIEKQNIEKVRNLLRRATELDLEQRKILLEDAQEKVNEAKDNVSLLKSKWDLAKLIGGGTVAIGGTVLSFGLGVISYACYKGYTDFDQQLQIRNDRDRAAYARVALIMAIGSGVSAAVGGYFALKGYFCDTAYGKVTEARKIAELIKKAPVKGEQQQPTEQTRSVEQAA